MKVLLVLLLLPAAAMADYQTENFKQSVCETAAQGAMLQAQASNAHKDVDVAAQLEKGSTGEKLAFFQCTSSAPIRKAKELAGYGHYDPKEAYMRAWSYCMDKIEGCAYKHSKQ